MNAAGSSVALRSATRQRTPSVSVMVSSAATRASVLASVDSRPPWQVLRDSRDDITCDSSDKLTPSRTSADTNAGSAEHATLLTLSGARRGAGERGRELRCGEDGEAWCMSVARARRGRGTGVPTRCCEKGVEVVGPTLLAGPMLGCRTRGSRVAPLRPHLARRVRAAGEIMGVELLRRGVGEEDIGPSSLEDEGATSVVLMRAAWW